MLLLLFAGCPAPEVADCDASAAVSVSVEVEGPEDPTVTYEHEGVEAACQSWPDGTWACGYEVAGEILVRAEADGWEPAEATVVVEQGECHVVGESVTLTMSHVACTEEERPSVVVTVAGSGGETLTGVEVTYAPADAAVEPSACDPYGDAWACGWEEAGDLVVQAVADGHAGESVTVTVPETADGCHVETQEVDFLLEWLPD